MASWCPCRPLYRFLDFPGTEEHCPFCQCWTKTPARCSFFCALINLRRSFSLCCLSLCSESGIWESQALGGFNSNNWVWLKSCQSLLEALLPLLTPPKTPSSVPILFAREPSNLPVPYRLLLQIIRISCHYFLRFFPHADTIHLC